MYTSLSLHKWLCHSLCLMVWPLMVSLSYPFSSFSSPTSTTLSFLYQHNSCSLPHSSPLLSFSLSSTPSPPPLSPPPSPPSLPPLTKLQVHIFHSTHHHLFEYLHSPQQWTPQHMNTRKPLNVLSLFLCSQTLHQVTCFGQRL